MSSRRGCQVPEDVSTLAEDVREIKGDVKDLAKQVNDLAVVVAGGYVPRDEYDAHVHGDNLRNQWTVGSILIGYLLMLLSVFAGKKP